MIKQSLNIASVQQLQLTPKLQQAISMLQLSTQELAQEIQSLVESNVALEADSWENGVDVPESDLLANKQGPDENLPVDIDWDNQYDNSTPYSSYSENSGSIIDWYSQPSESLHDHLSWQLNLSGLSELECEIGAAIIDSINDDGFLQSDLEDIQEAMQKINKPVPLSQVKKVLQHIQSFEPIGVGARNLQESLLIQLNALNQSAVVKLAKHLIKDHIDLIAHHDYQKLCRICRIGKDQLNDALSLIQNLKPRPGNSSSYESRIENIIPDVVVRKKGRSWEVLLNNSTLPKLRLNNQYLSITKDNSESASSFINQHLQEARWLMKCISNRNETLLKVAACIVKYQQAFMEYGSGAMKPLVLRDIAEDLGMHQSTISRITTRKYIQTPQGTFELKYFFTSHLNTSYGQQCSAMAIQAYIQDIVKSENPAKPFSDNEIAKKLLAQGIQVARRTIAKYRELLAIPPASQRKGVYRKAA